METARLWIRPMMKDEDEESFISGISDKSLRSAYGFPAVMDETVPPQIFRHFRSLENAYAIIEKHSGSMAGFLLDTEPELPEKLRAGLPEPGRTLAYAVFPPFQRRGYMIETLQEYIPDLFHAKGTAYIHCGHFTDNGPSRSLLQKLGFHEHGSHMLKDRMIIDEILSGLTEHSCCG